MSKFLSVGSKSIRYFVQLLKHDIREQILKHWYYFVLSVPLIIYLWMSLNDLIGFSGLSGQTGFMDLIIYIFYGEKEYIPQVSPFSVNIEFLLIQVVLTYSTAYYPVRDLSVRGRQIFIRVGKNTTWWYCKCIWLILTVVLYYFVIYLTAAILTGGWKMLPDKDFIATFGELYQMENGADYVLYCLILPIAASVAVLFVQMLLSMITAPVYGFFVVIFQVLLSFYFYSPFLPGNYQMFNRLALAREDGICAGQSFFICSIVIVSCIIIGAIYMKKRDIL